MIWSTGSIHKIEMQQPVGSASTPSGEILEVYQADDQPHWQGDGQDHGFTYNSTIGQVIWGIDDTVAGNEPVINFVTVDASVNPTVDPAAPATPLTNTQPTLCVWGDVGAAASYTFIQGGTGITNGTTRFSARTNSLGVDVDINVVSPVIDIGADVFATGDFINISYDTAETTTGAVNILNVFNAAFALTLGADLQGIVLDFNTNVVAADDRDVTGYRVALPALAQTTAVTTNFRGLYLSAAGAISDSSTTAFNWYGTDLVLPQTTVTGTATITVVGNRIASSGNLSTTTAAGTINWRGLDLSNSVGTVISNFAGSTIDWRGINIQLPAETQTAGTATVTGIQVTGGTVTSGTQTGINVTMEATYGGTQIAGVFQGDGRLTHINTTSQNFLSRPTTVDTGVDVAIDSLASPIIDIGADVFAGGTFIDIAYDTAETLTSALIGLNVNFGSDLTPAGTFGTTGIQHSTPAYTQSSADTTTLRGFYINTAGALVQNTAAGTLNWYGQEIVTPATTVSFAGASANINVFRVGTAGALTTDTGAGTLNYSVGVFTLPNVTQTLGQTNVIALDINAGTLAVADNSTTGAVYRGIDVSLPALTLNTPTGANTVNISGYRIDTAGAIITQDANSTINWTGMYIISPAITQTAGSIVAYGINLDLDAAVTTGGTLRGINAVMQGTYTTANEMFINATGDARLIQVLNTSNAVLLSPSSAGEGTDISFNVLEADTILLDFGIDKFPTGSVIVIGYDTIETSTGNIKVLEFTNAAALTLGGDLFGIDLDFSTNVTVATNQDITGYNITLPAFTESAANTTEYNAFKIDTIGNLETNTAAGTINFKGFDLTDSIGTVLTNFAGSAINWRGIHITSPATTQTAGTATVYGIDLDMDAAVTTGGTVRGINLAMQSTYTTANEIAMNITGDGRTIEIANTENAIDIIGAQSATGLIDINPNGTGTGDVINITPSAALVGAGNTWAAINITGNNLDPGGATNIIRGVVVDFSGIDQAQSPAIQGFAVDLPTTYATGGRKSAYISGHAQLIDFMYGLTTLTPIAVWDDTSRTNALFNLTGAGLIDINPRGTGSQNIIDITPAVAIDPSVVGGVVTWIALNVDAQNLDPSDNDFAQNIYGTYINFGQLTGQAGSTIYAHRVTVPDSPTGTWYAYYLANQSGNNLLNITSAGLIDINPRNTAAATYLDISTAAVVLTGAPVGINVNLSVATMANVSSTGFSFDINPDVIHTTAAGTYTHQNTIEGGTITVSPASGTTIANWYGLDISIPDLTANAAITETATINAYGLRITVGLSTLDIAGGTETINQAAIRILDATGADNLDLHHNGVSAIFRSNTAIDFLSTGDTDDFIRFQTITNVPGFHSRGACDLDIQNNNDTGGAIYDVTFFVNQADPGSAADGNLATGEVPELRIYGWNHATTALVFSVIRTSAVNETVTPTDNEVAVMRFHPANNRLVISEADSIEFTSASTNPTLSIYDAGGTDTISIYDDGSYSYIVSDPNNLRLLNGTNSAQSRRFMCGYDGAAPTLAGGGILAHTGVGGTAWVAGDYTLTTPGAGDATAGYWQMGAIADEILFSIPLPELQVDTSVEGEFTIQIYITNPAGTDRFDYAIYDWDGTPLAVGVDQAIGGTAQEYSINLGALAWSKGDSLIIALRGFESVAPAAIDARIFYIDYTYEVGIENNIA